MTDEQNESVMDDDKDPSHSHQRTKKKGRKINKGLEISSNIEQSAPPESKSDTEDNTKHK